MMTSGLRGALIVALLAAACGGDDDGDGNGGGYTAADIDSGALSGKVGGQPWTFVQGSTDSFLSDEDDFFGKLFNESFVACDVFTEPSGDVILVSIPTEVGEYDLNLNQNMTFAVDNENLIGTDGILVVESITATTIEAAMLVRYDADNELNGHFTVEVCP